MRCRREPLRMAPARRVGRVRLARRASRRDGHPPVRPAVRLAADPSARAGGGRQRDPDLEPALHRRAAAPPVGADTDRTSVDHRGVQRRRRRRGRRHARPVVARHAGRRRAGRCRRADPCGGAGAAVAYRVAGPLRGHHRLLHRRGRVPGGRGGPRCGDGGSDFVGRHPRAVRHRARGGEPLRLGGIHRAGHPRDAVADDVAHPDGGRSRGGRPPRSPRWWPPWPSRPAARWRARL